MVTKKNNQNGLERYGVGVLVAVVVLVILIVVAGALLFGFGINALANGNIALGIVETLVGMLLLSTVTLGGK